MFSEFLTRPQNTFDTAKISSYWWRIRSWENTPGFKDLPRSERPINDYTDVQATFSQKEHSGASWELVSDGVRHYLADYPPGQYLKRQNEINAMYRNRLSGFYWFSEVEKARVEARLDLAKKIGDVKANFPVFLHEAKKTFDMIEHACERLFLSYHAFRRGNFKIVAEILNLKPKTIHKNWLEYKYGWMPMLMDVKGQAEFASQQFSLGGRPPRFTVRANVKVEDGFDDLSRMVIPFGGSIPTVRLVETLGCDYEGYYKVWLELDCPTLAALQQTGLTNPAVLLYEATPYSFVFDWFYSVGDWLMAQTAFQGINIRKKMLSQRVTYHYFYEEPETIASDGITTYRNGVQHFEVEDRNYVRDSSTALDVSLDELSFHRPSFLHKDWQKAVSAIALARGAVRGDTPNIPRLHVRK